MHNLSIAFPENFVALQGLPGYFWDKQNQELYSLKVGGILRKLRLYTYTYYYGVKRTAQPHYQLSQNNRRVVLYLHDIPRLIEDPHMIPRV